MCKFECKAYAKINITLDAIRKMENGYHELEMIMQTVNLCDNLHIKKTDTGKVELKSNLVWLPCDSRNLVYRAAEYMRETYNIKEGIEIELVKNIPVAAGLAGGSSDCAATLVGINNLFRLNISQEELMKIGKSFGADVPYCILRGTSLAEGIGEKLTVLPNFPNCYVLLAKPPISVSTASVFGALDLKKVNKHPDTKAIIDCIEKGDLQTVSDNMVNVLETVTCEKYPVIEQIKKAMIDNGAIGSMMSGSGPTVFGFFSEYKEGLHALKFIKNKFRTKEVYLTTVFNIRQGE